MIRWFRSLFAWKLVRVEAFWAYEENAVTGKRRALSLLAGGYSPWDAEWLGDGEVIRL